MTWREISAAQGGVITRRQLRDSTCSDRTISRMIQRGALQRITRGGVYLVGGTPWSAAARTWAGVLMTDGVLGFTSAAVLWGMEVEAPPFVQVIVPTSRRPRPPDWVRVHRSFVPSSEVVRRDGLPVTSRARTAIDLIGHLPRRDAIRFADRALQRSWVTRNQLERRLVDESFKPGNRNLRTVLHASSAAAASEAERRLHQLLRRARLVGWAANHPVRDGSRVVAVIDVAFEQLRLAIEVDGWAFHSDVDRFRRDRQRQNDLVALGWTVLRFTWADLSERPDYVIAQIRHALGRT